MTQKEFQKAMKIKCAISDLQRDIGIIDNEIFSGCIDINVAKKNDLGVEKVSTFRVGTPIQSKEGEIKYVWGCGEVYDVIYKLNDDYYQNVRRLLKERLEQLQKIFAEL